MEFGLTRPALSVLRYYQYHWSFFLLRPDVYHFATIPWVLHRVLPSRDQALSYAELCGYAVIVGFIYVGIVLVGQRAALNERYVYLNLIMLWTSSFLLIDTNWCVTLFHYHYSDDCPCNCPENLLLTRWHLCPSPWHMDHSRWHQAWHADLARLRRWVSNR